MQNDEYYITTDCLFTALIDQIHFSVHDIDVTVKTSREPGYHIGILKKDLLYANEILNEWETVNNEELRRAYVHILLEKRRHYKKIKNYEKADMIRKAFNQKGVEIIDLKYGWKLKRK